MKKGDSGSGRGVGAKPADPKGPGGKYAPKGGSKLSSQRSKRDNTPKKKQSHFWTHLYHKYIHADTVVIANTDVAAAIEALGLTQKHLKQLKLQFEEIDLDGSGSIDSEEVRSVKGCGGCGRGKEGREESGLFCAELSKVFTHPPLSSPLLCCPRSSSSSSSSSSSLSLSLSSVLRSSRGDPLPLHRRPLRSNRSGRLRNHRVRGVLQRLHQLLHVHEEGHSDVRV